jgi:adenylate cyclase
VPISIILTIDFHLPWYSALVIFAGGSVAVAYAAILHFFASELTLRPVLRDAAALLPSDFGGMRVGVPLRWKLLGALPLINVITGVVVSGLSTNGDATLGDLGIDVLVAVGVAFTISFELTMLLTKSIYGPVDDLMAATERVAHGDLSARVPVLSGDELGELAGSFNEMMSGLEEREKLQAAFGSYVDPQVARRVLDEGELLEGDEVEVSVLFVDIRDFTPFAESASAAESVARLNEFFDLVVPILIEHGGHANKFVGDGVLGVFGAPDRLRDHADRALEAACEIAESVEERFGGRLRIGIGINSGPVIAGSIGGGGRLEFTVIGDPVNVAARVERATRQTGDVVLLTEATRCLLTRDEGGLEPRGSMPLKGKSDGVALWSAKAAPAGTARPLEALPDPA